jgi:hypothetical protein
MPRIYFSPIALGEKEWRVAMRLMELGLAAIIFSVLIAAAVPASADDRGAARIALQRTSEFAAQSRPHITIHPRQTAPGPNSLRYCRAWLAQEYRVSGPVIVPRMQCRWH